MINYKNLFFLLFIFIGVNAYKAAGVLPYAIDKKGDMYFLLGLSCVHNNTASDFGGLKDPSDKNNPVITAAREGAEELLFVFDKEDNFKKVLKLRKQYGHSFNIEKAHSYTYGLLKKYIRQNIQITSRDYIMYMVQIPYQTDLPKRMMARKKNYSGKLPHCWNETTQLVWIKKDDIFNAIDQQSNKNKPIIVHGYRLFKPFIASLIKARATGII